MLNVSLNYARYTARRLRHTLAGAPPFLRTIMAVPGELTEREAVVLYTLAQHVAGGCIVEIGSNYGRSTVALALGSASTALQPPVFAIEPHEHFVGELGGVFGPENRGVFFQSMLQTGCYRSVRLLNTRSEVVAPGWQQPVGLLWIDGDHRYEAVGRDLAVWEQHLLPGSLVAFHDALNPDLGPARLVRELLAQQRYIRLLMSDSIAVLRLR